MPDFIQKVGRAGQGCESMLHFNNYDLCQNVTGMTNDMREYCKTEKCLRSCILGNFGLTKPLETVPGCHWEDYLGGGDWGYGGSFKMIRFIETEKQKMGLPEIPSRFH